MMGEPTRADWLAALEEMSQRNDAGMTVSEMSAELGINEKRLHRHLREARDMGWLVTGQRTITNLRGSRINTPVYRVVRPVVPLQKAGGQAGHTPRNRR